MDSNALFDAFRSDVVDEVAPHLWSSAEVWRYMDDAYTMFVRLTGGVSDVMTFDITAGEAVTEVSPKIMRYTEATLDSTGRPLTIINPQDKSRTFTSDYGQARILFNTKAPGDVRAMVIGGFRNRSRSEVTWIQLPEKDDTATVEVFRLPLEPITAVGGQEFEDIGEEHHIHLLMWMKYHAYGKQDAETFDRGKRDGYKKDFEQYCALAKAEADRHRHKNRVVSYGGL